MGVKNIRQIAEKKEELSKKIIQKEQTTSIHNSEKKEIIVETYNYDPREYLRGKYLLLSNITPNLSSCTFENANVLSETERNYKRRFEIYCNKFEENYRNNGLGLLMYGGAGLGKTYYSDCIYNELSKKGYVVYRTTLLSIFQRFKNTYNPHIKLNIQDVIKEIKECDLIILDDLGNENITETWGEENLYFLLNYLHENNISLILSTNLSVGELKNYLSIRGKNVCHFVLKEQVGEKANFKKNSRK